MKLKPAGIIVVVLIIAILAYLAFKPKTNESGTGENTEYTTTQPERDKPAGTRYCQTCPG